MIAGSLEIDLRANLARLSQDMSQAKGMVGSAMKGIESAVSSAKTALAGLGVGLSIGYFAALIRGSIDALDHLNDLSKATKIAASDLSGLQLAAKQSGGDLDGAAAAINKLSQNIGKEPEKFRLLGVTAKEPLEAFKQLADAFTAIRDPQLRAAVGAEALGKSWQAAAPLLEEGGKRIGEMIARGKQLSGVTDEAVKKADEFNDKLAELKTASGKAGTTLASDLVGPLTEITNAVIQAQVESGKLAAAWTLLGGVAALIIGDTEAQKTKQRIKEITGEIELARRLLTQSRPMQAGPVEKALFGFLMPEIKFGEEAVAKLKETIKELEREKQKLEGIKVELSKAALAQNQRELNRIESFGPNADANASAFLRGEVDAEKIAVARAKIALEARKDLFDKQKQVAELEYKDGLTSLDTYYTQREEMIQRKRQAEMAGIAQQIKAQQDIENKPGAKAEERTAAQIKILELTAEQRKADWNATMEYTALQFEKKKALLDFHMAANKAIVDTLKQEEEARERSEELLSSRGAQFSQDAQDAGFQKQLLEGELAALRTLGPEYGEISSRTKAYHIQRELLNKLRQLDNDELREEIRLNGLNLSEMDLAIAKERLYQQTRERRAQIPDEIRDQVELQSKINDTRQVAETMQGAFVDGWRTFREEVRKSGNVLDALGKGAERFAMRVVSAIEEIQAKNLAAAIMGQGSGGAGGFFGSLLKMFGMSGGGAASSSFSSSGTSEGIALAISTAHTGGIVGGLTDSRMIDPRVFDGAPRFHRGGLMSGEVPVIAKDTEGIFTAEQMRALAPAGDRGNVVNLYPTINIDSRTDAAVIRQEVNRGMAQAIASIPDKTRRGGSYRKAVRG